jgi:antitoxin component of RelBE/YafQ-DinJ toxin-antitoxin module
MGTQKQDKYLHVRIDKDLKESFINFCDNNSVTASKIIKKFIKSIINGEVK